MSYANEILRELYYLRAFGYKFADFSPSSVAVFEVPGEWALLDGADARLIDFMSF